MPVGPLVQDESIKVELEFDGKKHALLDLLGEMAKKTTLHKYVIVPDFGYDEELREVVVEGYSFIHVHNIGRYLKKLETCASQAKSSGTA